MVVITVMAILATIVAVSFRGIKDRAHDVAVQADLRSVGNQLELAGAMSELPPYSKSYGYDPQSSDASVDESQH